MLRYCEPYDVIHIIRHLDISQNWYVDGYWQNELYFQKEFDEICEKYQFPVIVDSVNKKISEQIQKTNSVAVHIRRGDYVNSAFDILTDQYYKNAIAYIQDKIINPIFYFFSEDEEYVKEKYAWLDSKVIVHNNTGYNSWRDMQLMSLCKHGIVANSSFSTWGGFLNQNPNKIEIYPAKYRNDEATAQKIEKGWIRMDV